MLIATKLHVMGLQVHLNVHPEMHRGDIKTAMVLADRAALALTIMVERGGGPSVVHPLLQGARTPDGSLLECRS